MTELILPSPLSVEMPSLFDDNHNEKKKIDFCFSFNEPTEFIPIDKGDNNLILTSFLDTYKKRYNNPFFDYKNGIYNHNLQAYNRNMRFKLNRPFTRIGQNLNLKSKICIEKIINKEIEIGIIILAEKRVHNDHLPLNQVHLIFTRITYYGIAPYNDDQCNWVFTDWSNYPELNYDRSLSFKLNIHPKKILKKIETHIIFIDGFSLYDRHSVSAINKHTILFH